MSIFDEINIPNLDALDNKDLMCCATIFRRLADYSDYVLRAKVKRIEGKILAAQQIEEAAEKIYKSLPEEIKW